MKKIYFSIILVLCLLLTSGCSKSFNFDGKCFITEDDLNGICFDANESKVYNILKVNNVYRGTYSEEDIYTYEQSINNSINVYNEITMRVLEKNENSVYKLDKEYKFDNNDKSLTFSQKDKKEEIKFILSDIKLKDVEFEKKIKIPVKFFEETSKFELSNTFMTTISGLTLPIKDIEINDKYTFILYGKEVFYLKKGEVTLTPGYTFIYRNLLSKYKLCYETDNGVNYFEIGNALKKDITFYNIDYCSNYNIKDYINVDATYSTLAGNCYDSQDKRICFSDELDKLYFSNKDNNDLKTFNIKVQDGLYTFDNNKIIVMDSLSSESVRNKLEINSVEYNLVGTITDICSLCQ